MKKLIKENKGLILFYIIVALFIIFWVHYVEEHDNNYTNTKYQNNQMEVITNETKTI